MFYREAGQFKTTYRQDMAIFPILQDRIGLALIFAVAVVGVPLLTSKFFVSSVMIPFLVFSLAAIGLNILTGYTGLISLGTGAFMGVGAYACYKLTTYFPGVNIIVWILLSGFFSAGIGVLFGIPSLRVKGFYLAVATGDGGADGRGGGERPRGDARQLQPGRLAQGLGRRVDVLLHEHHRRPRVLRAGVRHRHVVHVQVVRRLGQIPLGLEPHHRRLVRRGRLRVPHVLEHHPVAAEAHDRRGGRDAGLGQHRLQPLPQLGGGQRGQRPRVVERRDRLLDPHGPALGEPGRDEQPAGVGVDGDETGQRGTPNPVPLSPGWERG